MGWHRRWQSHRAYDSPLEAIWGERRKIDLGRGSGGGFARRTRESKSAGDRQAHAGRVGGFAKNFDRGAPADHWIGRRTLDWTTVDALRKILPAECSRKTGTTHSLSSSDSGSKIGTSK